MPSTSYRRWAGARENALTEIEHAHTAVGGTERGRRHATQQINQAYAVLLASQFQGFCRDLHTESLNHLIAAISPARLQFVVLAELTKNRQLDRGNAQPGSIGADFGRLGIEFWTEVKNFHPDNATRQVEIAMLNNWRNAIAHQDFDPARLGGRTTLRLSQVQRWRVACRRLARSFDEVMYRYLSSLTGISPW